ncbi:MAG: hypothetical protein ACLP9L_15445, partial [Thermoguttaceae bacterium]
MSERSAATINSQLRLLMKVCYSPTIRVTIGCGLRCACPQEWVSLRFACSTHPVVEPKFASLFFWSDIVG